MLHTSMMRSFFLLITVALLISTDAYAMSNGDTTSLRRAADTTVMIGGEVGSPGMLGLSDLLRLPSHSVQTTDHGGTTLRYEGVLLSDVLKLVGAPQGEQLRGRYLAGFYLLVSGTDGYGAIFALPEADPTFTDREIILAYRVNGVALSNHDGPLQVIVPSDKRHGRWVRQVTSIEIVRSAH